MEDINIFWLERDHSTLDVAHIMIEILEKLPEIFSSDESRPLIHSFLVLRGTDALLQHVNDNDPELGKTIVIANLLLPLENHDSTKENPLYFFYNEMGICLKGVSDLL